MPIINFYVRMATIILIFIKTLVFCWPDGAPCIAVDTMTPNHKGGRFERRPPYRIRIGAACYRPGISIPITLRGQQASDRFKGFSLQARIIDEVKVSRVGEFLDANSRDFDFQCKDSKDSITHKWKDDKHSITAQWHVPNDTMGAVRFIATVVKSYSTYWVQQVRSRRLKPCSDIRKKPEEKGEATTTTKKPQETQAFAVPAVESAEIIEEEKPKATLCDFQAEIGICEEPKGYQERWYHHRGSCYTFWYSGCGGNKNNFVSKEACKAQCVKEIVVRKKDPRADCKHPTDRGNWCKPPGWTTMYTYDGENCVEFRFGGCGGNQNRFETEQECKETCILTASKSCLKFRDRDSACLNWIKGFDEACDEAGGSGVVRNLCPRSCCEHLRLKEP